MKKSVHIFFMIFTASIAFAGISPVELKCEYQQIPIAIETQKPRLSWQLTSPEKNQVQTAYRILVAGSVENLEKNLGDLWDSGKVESCQQLHIEYKGKSLTSEQQCFWKVRVWDKAGVESDWSKPIFWQMGLLSSQEWKGSWITFPEKPAKSSGLLFRKEFRLDQPIKRATAFICGVGQFELLINGEKIGDHVMEPEWTNYRKTCPYVTFDVTAKLRKENAVAVLLGNGMYNVEGGRYIKFVGSFGQPKLILQLNIELADGSKVSVVSNQSWKTAPSPITFTCIYGGEDYDARLEQTGWTKAGFDDTRWENADVVNGPGGHLTAQISPPIKVMKTYEPIEITEPKSGVFVYDLGQNFSGWPAINVKGKRGSTVKLIPGELLDSNGLVTQRGSGGPVSFSYTLNGNGLESWHPRFTYYGFRYVQVEGASPHRNDETIFLKNLKGHFIHSSSAKVGQFECSNPLFNDIHRIINAAMRSNMQSVFTDCPHREKLGWLEETHLLGHSLLYNYDLANLYTKAMVDMRDAQLESGLIPDIAPEYVEFNGGFRDSPEWGSAYIINPWNLYRFYGDIQVLATHYERMKKYVTFLISMAENNIVFHGLGDWYDIGPGTPGVSKLTPPGITGTAILLQDLDILFKSAKLLNKKNDSEFFKEQKTAFRSAFNQTFYDDEKIEYKGNSQTASAMTIALDIVDDSVKDKILTNLIHDIHAQHNHITAGDVGHLYVLRALAQNGRSDIICDMASRTDVPSYGAQLRQGVTSLTEAWDAGRHSSQNHFMLGHIEEWFYKYVGGIQLDDNAVGFDKFLIAPEVVGDLTWARASYNSIRGLVKSEWELRDGIFSLETTIPPNTNARVVLPCKSPKTVLVNGNPIDPLLIVESSGQNVVLKIGSGNYSFSTEYFQTVPTGPPSKQFVYVPKIFPQDTLVYKSNSIKVSMTTETENTQIRYTLDGGEPDEHSELYNGPFEISTQSTLIARAYHKKMSPSFSTKPVNYSFVDPDKNGLNYTYYEGKWPKLPNFQLLKPVRSGKTFSFNTLLLNPRNDFYAIQYDGFIQLEKSGIYTFYLSSDDGSRFFIDNDLFIDNDGIHGIIEKTASKYLKSGEHSIKIQYFEDVAGEFLGIKYEGPGIIKQTVPANKLFLQDD